MSCVAPCRTFCLLAFVLSQQSSKRWWTLEPFMLEPHVELFITVCIIVLQIFTSFSNLPYLLIPRFHSLSIHKHIRCTVIDMHISFVCCTFSLLINSKTFSDIMLKCSNRKCIKSYHFSWKYFFLSFEIKCDKVFCHFKHCLTTSFHRNEKSDILAEVKYVAFCSVKVLQNLNIIRIWNVYLNRYQNKIGKI
jgi:hypothetical protein